MAETAKINYKKKYGIFYLENSTVQVWGNNTFEKISDAEANLNLFIATVPNRTYFILPVYTR